MKVYDAASMRLESIDCKATIAQAAEHMRSANVGLLLVKDGNALVGVVTDRDIVTRAAADRKSLETHVRDIMSAPVVCIRGQAGVREAAHLMSERHVRRLVVTNDEDVPVGLLSIDNIAFSTHGDETAGGVLEDLAQGREGSSLVRPRSIEP